MKKQIISLIFGIGANLSLFAGLAQAQTVICYDDFNGPSLNTNVWGVGNWWVGSRTNLGKQPTFGNEGVTTFMTLTLDTFNPSFPGEALYGTEVYSLAQYSVGQGIEFEARVRVRTEINGIVDAFFTYASKGTGTSATSDEIDFEYLCKQPKTNVLATSWNDWKESYADNDGIHQSSEMESLPSLDRSLWNVLKIRWLPDHTEWYVNDVLIRTTTAALANDPMNLHINSWAPASTWTDAYDAILKPVTTAGANASYYYDVDYIKVTSLGAAAPLAPSNLTATVMGASIALNWQDNSNNETGFRVFRAAKPSAKKSPVYSLIATVGQNVKAYTDNPAVGTWLYTVKAVNSVGPSSASNTAQATRRR